MFARCSNWNCATDFDYRQGRFFRFLVPHPEGKAPANAHPVRHFWLCQQCSEVYTLQYRNGRCVLIPRHYNRQTEDGMLEVVAAT
jgi:hypothetical protein